MIENCSSGGMRFDLGIMGHTHTNWLSDVVAPLPSVQLAYGCTLEFSPAVCNHWMIGDGEGERAAVDNNAPPGWWDFILRVPMNGQYGISSKVFDWSPALRKRAAENVALYKRIRGSSGRPTSTTSHRLPPTSSRRTGRRLNM
jgi:alpha-galactosidase